MQYGCRDISLLRVLALYRDLQDEVEDDQDNVGA